MEPTQVEGYLRCAALTMRVTDGGVYRIIEDRNKHSHADEESVAFTTGWL